MGSNRQVALIAAVLSLGWFLVVGFIDRGLLDRNGPMSLICLNEYLPPGTVHNPEGWPSLPVAEYRFIPLALECTFRMTDGSTTESFHPRAAQSAIAGLPLLLTLIWIAVTMGRLPRTPKKDPLTSL